MLSTSVSFFLSTATMFSYFFNRKRNIIEKAQRVRRKRNRKKNKNEQETRRPRRSVVNKSL